MWLTHADRHTSWIFTGILWCSLLNLAVAKPNLEVQSLRLTPTSDAAPARVKIVFEVEGKLLSQSADRSAEPQEHDLKAVGNFLYEERLVDSSQQQALRYYLEAAADVVVQAKPDRVKLREARRYMVVEPRRTKATFRSLQGPLTREELELVEVPGGSHLIDRLLPGREVNVGETWTHDDQLMAELLNLDAVTGNDVKSELVAVTGDDAQLALSGKIVGSVGGVMSEIDLRGRYNFDRSRQRITWLALGIGESRSIGLTVPGLRAQARLRMLVEAAPTPHLEPETLEPILTGAPERHELLEYQPESSGFTLVHDRRWYVFRETQNLFVLRFVDEGQLLAQCNLQPLTPLSADVSVSLAQFQQEVRQALGSAAQQIVDAQDSTLPNQLRQLRVAVVGQVANAPIHWVYYQLIDPQNRRMSCVFTMSGEDAGRFGAEDLSLLGGLSLGSPSSDSSEGSDELGKELALTPTDRQR